MQEPERKGCQKNSVPAVRKDSPREHQGQPHPAGIPRHGEAGKHRCGFPWDVAPPGCLASCSLFGMKQTGMKCRWNDLEEEDQGSVQFSVQAVVPRVSCVGTGKSEWTAWNSASGTSTLWSRAKNLSQDKMNGKGPEACRPVQWKQKCDPRPGRPSGLFSRATEGGTLILPSTRVKQIFKRMQNYQIILLKVIKMRTYKLAPGVVVFSLCVSAFILGPQATCTSHPQTPGLRLFQRGCLRTKQQVLK